MSGATATAFSISRLRKSSQIVETPLSWSIGILPEPHYLGAVQGHGENAVGTCLGEQVGHQPAGDRYARFVLAVGQRIRVVGQYRGDATSGGELQRVQGDEQFHQVLADRCAGGLNKKDVAAADVLADLYLEVFVAEADDLEASRRYSQRFADSRREVGIAVSRKDLELVGHLSSAYCGRLTVSSTARGPWRQGERSENRGRFAPAPSSAPRCHRPGRNSGKRS